MMHLLAAIAVSLLLVPSAWAVINPELTPVHLVRQSEQVWRVELSPGEQHRVNVKVLAALKGELPQRGPVIEGCDIAQPQAGVLFIADAAGSKVASLYAQAKWYRLTTRTPVLWQAEAADRSLGGTWNGSVEMLARAVEYVQSDPAATVPAACDAAWGQAQSIAKGLGLVHGLQAIDDGHGLALVVGQRHFKYSADKNTLVGVPDTRVILDVDDSYDPVGFQPPGNPLSGAIADFEADGKLDRLTTYKDGCRIFTNGGEGQFADTTADSGDLAALAGKANGAQTCDINNDGRPDILAWTDKGSPQFFYNRGFRCFALATNLSLEKHPLLNRIQCATVADFNGDGCQDLAAVTTDGELVFLPRDPNKGNKLCVSVSLSQDLATVSAIDGKRPLGAQFVGRGQPAFFGKTGKGPLKIEWRLRNGEVKSKQVIVLKSMQVVLDP